jgi:glucose-1-phosphate adenylyltransferase
LRGRVTEDLQGHSKMKKVVATILAGGQGQRMGVLCQYRSKPMLPFGPGCHVIDFTLSNCVNSSISDILVAVDYQRKVTGNYVTQWGSRHLPNGEIRVLDPGNGGYAGTADAVYQNLEHLAASGADEVIILAGDHVYCMDYSEPLDFHRTASADVTICSRTVPLNHARRFGVVSTDSQGRISGFVEKPEVPVSNLASMGVYIFKTSVLLDSLKKDHSRTSSRKDFGHDIIPAIIKEVRAFAYVYDGYWRDIGTIEAYFAANMDYLKHRFPVDTPINLPILTNGSQFRYVRASTDGRISNSFISDTSRIEGKIADSIIADNAHIGREAIVSNSLVLSNAEIGDYSRVDHCVLDEDVMVDRVCRIGKTVPVQGKPQVTVLQRGTRVSQYEAICLDYARSKCLGIGYYSNPQEPELVLAR